jgi:hypothetical protein
MKIASKFSRPDGVVIQRFRVIEEDYLPDSAALMQYNTENKMRKGEQMAAEMRRSIKKSIISSKRGLFGYKNNGKGGLSYLR